MPPTSPSIVNMNESITLRFLAEPNDVNFGGKVRGGTVMKWIDQAGYACAAGYSERYAVTIYVGGIRFFKPIHVGHVVEAEAKVIYTGNSSMHILVSISSKNPKYGNFQLTTRCIIVFVAVDEEGNSTPIKKWVPKTEEEKKLELYAQKLMEGRETLQHEVKPFSPDTK